MQDQDICMDCGALHLNCTCESKIKMYKLKLILTSAILIGLVIGLAVFGANAVVYLLKDINLPY